MLRTLSGSNRKKDEKVQPQLQNYTFLLKKKSVTRSFEQSQQMADPCWYLVPEKYLEYSTALKQAI